MVRRQLMRKQLFRLNIKYNLLFLLSPGIFIILILELFLHDMNEKFTVYTLPTGWLPVYLIAFIMFNMLISKVFTDSMYLKDFKTMKFSKRFILHIILLSLCLYQPENFLFLCSIKKIKKIIINNAYCDGEGIYFNKNAIK
jgi:hypothetical protein